MNETEIFFFVCLIITIVGAINWAVVLLGYMADRPTFVPDLFYFIGLSSLQPFAYALVGAAGVASAVKVGLGLGLGLGLGMEIT